MQFIKPTAAIEAEYLVGKQTWPTAKQDTILARDSKSGLRYVRDSKGKLRLVNYNSTII